MTQIVRLWDEKLLIGDLKQDTLNLIHGCKAVPPIKKFVECYDILDLTLAIQTKFPTVWPEIPICDADALLHLNTIVRELLIYHGPDIPHPDFDVYTYRVRRLLKIFQVPKEEYGRL